MCMCAHAFVYVCVFTSKCISDPDVWQLCGSCRPIQVEELPIRACVRVCVSVFVFVCMYRRPVKGQPSGLHASTGLSTGLQSEAILGCLNVWTLHILVVQQKHSSNITASPTPWHHLSHTALPQAPFLVPSTPAHAKERDIRLSAK